MIRRPPRSTLLSLHDALPICFGAGDSALAGMQHSPVRAQAVAESGALQDEVAARSEEHTSELQSQSNLVCRLLLEKKKGIEQTPTHLPYHSGDKPYRYLHDCREPDRV